MAGSGEGIELVDQQPRDEPFEPRWFQPAEELERDGRGHAVGFVPRLMSIGECHLDPGHHDPVRIRRGIGSVPIDVDEVAVPHPKHRWIATLGLALHASKAGTLCSPSGSRWS